MKRYILFFISSLALSVCVVVYGQQTPDKIYGMLFSDVQMNRVFSDNKTFADAIPKRMPVEILEDYERVKYNKDFSLLSFVNDNFAIRKVNSSDYKLQEDQSVSKHITQLWKALERTPDIPIEGSSLLALPNDYVVPGGRFQEIYYWDTYFTMLGLEVDGRYDLIEKIVNNFDYLLKTYGHIPNGTRTYYLSRSQPPFFSLMVSLLAGINGDEVYKKYNQALQIEYDYWMDLTAPTKHVVSIDNQTVMNRYWDQLDRPRQESYYEDSTLFKSKGEKAGLYRELRSGAESGWDFSSRWFTNANDLSTIRCTDMIPVDLNALLYHLEKTLALSYALLEDSIQSSRFLGLTKMRLDAVNKFCYDPESGWYYDYVISENKLSDAKTLAGMMPFFVGMAPLDYNEGAAACVEKYFLKPGGVVTTNSYSGQQWDAPNGWAPLQWITIKGLSDYGKNELAEIIAERWIALNRKVYNDTGKLMEKYNVEDLGLVAGGGEYPAQDGFGWTNGVLQRLINDYE